MGMTYVLPTVAGRTIPPRLFKPLDFIKKFGPLDGERVPIATGLAFSFLFSFLPVFSLSRSSLPKPNPKTHISSLSSSQQISLRRHG
jgi:hypothetical protein